jgi:peptide deformylase
MFETMYIANGIGLAANQVGVSKSLIVIDVNSGNKEKKYDIPPIALINPTILEFSEELFEYEEGCLSVPQFYEYVIRPKLIQVHYYDLNGNEQSIDADEMLARVIQHEFDHLNGILFFERLTAIKRTLAKSKLRKIQKGQIKTDYPMISQDGILIE